MVEKNDPEVDLATFGSILWHSKIVIALFLFISFFWSLNSISNRVPVYKAETIIDLKAQSPNVKQTAMQNAQYLVPGFRSLNFDLPEDSISAIPQITGRVFLRSFAAEFGIKEKLKYKYQYTKPSVFTLSGILHTLKIIEQRPLTKNQIEDNLVETLKSMIKVEKFEYNKTLTNAHVISVTNKDPVLAAYIANKLADYFFQVRRDEQIAKYEKTLRYLSTSVGKAQIKMEESKGKLETFLLENPTVYGTNSNSGLDSVGVSDSAAIDITSLGELEDQQLTVERAVQSLTLRKDFDAIKFYEEHEKDPFFKVLSNKFVQLLREVREGNYDESVIKSMMIKETELERKRLFDLNIALLKLIKKRKKIL